MTSKLSEIYQNVVRAIQELGKLLVEERSVSFSQIYDQIFAAAMQMEEWLWPIDVYREENGDLSVIFTKDGLLFRSSVTIDNGGVTLGELVEVQQYFEPVPQSRFKISRSADGHLRWFIQASSSVLNRNGAIDSTQLFDKMNARARETGKYPYLTFFHQGESMRMGITDWIERSDNILIASGTFDEGSILAQWLIEATDRDPDYWGSSISFWPFDFHLEPIAEGIKVPMYTDGEYEEISVLPEELACCLFTAVHSTTGKVLNMRDDVREALLKLAGPGQEDLVEKFIAQVDESNEEITNRGLITREQTPDPEASTESAPADPAPDETQESEIQEHTLEMDETLESEIVELMVNHPTIKSLFKKMDDQITNLQKELQGISQELNDHRSAVAQRDEVTRKKLDVLSQQAKAQQQDWEDDLPANTSRGTRTIHRAKIVKPADDEPATLEEVASETVAMIK